MVKTALAAAAATLVSSAAIAAPLTFNTLAPGQSSAGTGLFGAPTASGLTVDFLGVGTEFGLTVDARVTATVKPQTQFGDGSSNSNGANAFHYDYTPNGVEPNDDFGFLYTASGVNGTENGVTFDFQFFDGTGSKSGTFLESIVLKELNIAVYDVDGEPSQSEFVRARTQDGLVSYALGTTPQALTATNEGGGIFRFDGPGVNFDEDDPAGAAILTYANTDFFQLSFGSVQSSRPKNNSVFSAIDGDLSLFDPNDFEVSPVPLPAGGVLLASAFGLLAWRSRRKTA